jgi:tetratricopeptide (TPR) repeat protein
MTPSTIQQTFQLALEHHQAGRLGEAQVLYRNIIAQNPSHAGATHFLGIIAHQHGQSELAIELIRKSIDLNPNVAEAYSNLGNALRDRGRLDEAIVSFQHAIAIKPDFAIGYNNLGNALRDKRQLDEAMAAYRKAIALRADYADAYSNIGTILRDHGRLEEAIAAFRQAIVLDPKLAEAHNNLGKALGDLGQTDRAIAAFRDSIALDSAYAEAHLNLAISLLARGELPEGWAEYEWRWNARDFAGMRRNTMAPQWDGSPLHGRTLLLQTEQGLGDAIQFIRYLPTVTRCGGPVIVECHPQVRTLFQRMAGTCVPIPQVISRGEALPPFDLHCPLLTLPFVLKTTLDTIPVQVPYLFPDEEEVERWGQRLNALGAGLKIGVAWAGSPTNKLDQTRSLSLDRLAPLAAEVSGVIFISLQKGPAASQAKSPPPGMKLIDWSDEFSNFRDAALMANLDLILTVDTSVAHLAGALARPTWVLLSFVPDWRWLMHREDSPWYPTMRLFRQTSRGDWESVIRRLAQALRDQAGAPSP